MWSLLKSSGWWLNIDSFVFPISGNYPCWKELIHFGKRLFSNLWSTETFFSILCVQTDCWPSSGAQAQTTPRQALSDGIFPQMKLGQGENSEQFEAGEKKKKTNPEMQHKAEGRRRRPPASFTLVKANGLSHESQAFPFSAAAFWVTAGDQGGCPNCQGT